MKFNEYKPDDTCWVTKRQFFGGTMAAFALLAMYVLFAWVEG